MPKSKVPAPRELTVTRATAEARRLVDRIMPGVGATVESRRSYDMDSDTPTIITVITHPAGHPAAFALWTALVGLPGHLRAGSQDSARMVVTRAQ